MMIKKYLSKKYINNYSDILAFSNDKEFKKIISNLNSNIYIKVSSHLIHKNNKINQYEQFIFNLDNYITFIRNKVFINNLELRYIINNTLYNKYSKVLYNIDYYYYEHLDYYYNVFEKMFMFQYLKNTRIIGIKAKKFNELINFINLNKKRTYCLFEKITNNNKFFYSFIYDSLFNKSI